MGSDQMADLDSIQVPINEQSASSAAGDDLLCPEALARVATPSDEFSPRWTGRVNFDLTAFNSWLSTIRHQPAIVSRLRWIDSAVLDNCCSGGLRPPKSGGHEQT